MSEDKADANSLKFNNKDETDILQSQLSSVFTIEPVENIPSLDEITDN